MAVAEGREGKVTIRTTAGNAKVAEMGTWSITGWTRDMVEHSAFQDTVKKFKPGMLDAGTISFSGFYDGTDSSGQAKLIAAFTSGKAISNSSARKVRKLRLWANDSTALTNYGFWSCVGSSGALYLTQIELGQEKGGLGTISFTAKATSGVLVWATAT